MASTAGIAPATSTFARWRSDLTELRGQNGIRDRTCTDLASQALQVCCPVIDVRFANRSGPTLKGRLRELLCIHARTKMVPEVGIAPTSPRLQRGANLPQLLGEMVVPAGNAPASSGYQPGALLLSYRTYGKLADGVGIAPTQP